MNLGALDLVLNCLLAVNTVSRAIWVWKPQGSPDWIASLAGLCCLPVWFSPVTAVRIRVLPFWGGYADWGSDEDDPSSFFFFGRLSRFGVSDEASWLLLSSVLLLHNGLLGSCLGLRIQLN